MAETSNGEISLSLEETNRQRIKLGLQPLSAPKVGKEKAKDAHKRSTAHSRLKQEEVGVKKDEWGRILVPVENIRDKKNEEKIREKLEIRKQKRQAEKQLRVKTLGASSKVERSNKNKVDVEEADDDEDDLAKWVQHQEKISRKNKRKFDQLQKKYQEEDQQKLKAQYKSKDTVGIEIGHDIDDLNDFVYMLYNHTLLRILIHSYNRWNGGILCIVCAVDSCVQVCPTC